MIPVATLHADWLRLQSRNPPIIEVRPIASPFSPGSSNTENLLIAGRLPGTVTQPVLIEERVISPLERTIATLKQFAQVPAAGTASPARQALQFLDAIPKHLPAPKAVESDSGVVTLFWETGAFYADVEFFGDSKFSVFTRTRTAGGSQDDVLDEHPLDDVNGAWLRQLLGPLFGPIQSNAA
jgi:hypothetical protein